MSPGMKKRIRLGQYEFPKPEWAEVSDEAKELIRGCLNTNPEERLTIDQVLQTKWVSVSRSFLFVSSLPNTCDLFQQCNTVPQTPLQTGSILKEQTEEEKEGLSLALREVREGFAAHQNNFILKNPKLDSNSALANRRKSKNSSSEVSSLNSSACDVKSIQEN